MRPTCKKVVTTNKGALRCAVDGHKPCGPNGYANAARLGAAQNTALKQCYKFGGKDCVIRAFMCDVGRADAAARRVASRRSSRNFQRLQEF